MLMSKLTDSAVTISLDTTDGNIQKPKELAKPSNMRERLKQALLRKVLSHVSSRRLSPLAQAKFDFQNSKQESDLPILDYQIICDK